MCGTNIATVFKAGRWNAHAASARGEQSYCDHRRDRSVERSQNRGKLLAPLIRSVDDREKDPAAIGSAVKGTAPEFAPA